jgi:polysaccharide biosynthesis/export protein
MLDSRWILLFVAIACTVRGQNTPAAVPDASKTAQQPTLQSRDQRYQLGRNDVFEVDFLLTPEFNQTVTIQPDGYISLRGVGDVRVVGQTIPQACATIRTAYAKVLDNPTVVIVLKDFEKPYFVAGGWVDKPGKYDLRGETTLSQAIQVAGGFKDGAKQSQVILFRSVSNDWVEVKKLNVKHLMKGEDVGEDIRLRPGDMFFVPKSSFASVAPFLPRASLGTYFPID